MRNTLFVLMLTTTSSVQFAFSQSTNAKGTVLNQENKPIAGALVSEFKSKNAAATYTDSSGFFKLPVSDFPKLSVSSKGYNDTLVNVVDKNNVVIVLSGLKPAKRTSDVNSGDQENPLIVQNHMKDAIANQSGINNSYVYGGGVRNYTGSLMPVFTHKEDTEGSRYLFNEWAHGFVINADNSVVDNPAYLYNYDKMGGGFLFTTDKISAIEVNKDQVKTFSIYAKDKENPLTFEYVPAIDNTHFVQLISSGSKYKIYKLIKTKFVKSNYHTDGIATSGNPYDEYIDENNYFVVNVQSNQIQKLGIKKKAVKEAFPAEADKLNTFFSDNAGDKIDDIFLKKMGDFLNN